MKVITDFQYKYCDMATFPPSLRPLPLYKDIYTHSNINTRTGEEKMRMRQALGPYDKINAKWKFTYERQIIVEWCGGGGGGVNGDGGVA